MDIDWRHIEEELGVGRTTGEGTRVAFIDERIGRRALENLLGERAIENAVETAARYRPGFGVAESVLSVLRCEHATNYCYRRFREETDEFLRQSYISVLRCCATDTALAWLKSLLEDEDEVVQVLAAKMLERLIVQGSEAEDDEIRAAIELGARHANPVVREQVQFAQDAFDRRRALSLLPYEDLVEDVVDG